METSAEFANAAFEFHRYLSDQVAPLMIVDEFGVLLRNPPEALSIESMRWISETRPKSEKETADKIVHAVRKIAMMGEFDLVPRAALGAFLNDYCQEILPSCPPKERPRLIESLVAFGKSLTAPGALLAQPPVVAVQMKETVARRMAVFLDQLGTEAPGARRDEVASEFMATAAMEASTREELDATLAPLKGVGIDPATENVLNSIARSLPGWGALEAPDAGSASPGERLGAMRQIVALGDDEAEIAKRFREMVHAAIAQFNGGNLGQAQSILVLAQQMVTDQRVKPAYVDSLRNASDYLDMNALRTASEKPENLPALRTMMSFFHALSPDGLLKSLRGEADENRRHDLSSLLEAHGAEGRAKAVDQLDAPEAVGDTAFAAAALRLLRRIPRPADVPIDHEVDVVLKHAAKGTDPIVATQAIYFLGQSKGDKVERALVGLQRMYEGMLARPAAMPASSTVDEVSALLDRTCGALARCGTPRCLKALVDHGMKTQPELGDCAKRLAEGIHADFTKHPELQARLIEALKAELPRAVLGLKLRKETGRSASFVKALSGTPSAEVKAFFQDIVKKHGDEEYGTLAAEALETFTAKARPPEPPASTFSGDLSFFGLPMLLQTLGQGGMTGLLSLINASGETASKLWLLEGRLQHASYGRLSADDALYELLIRPFPGTFAFVHRKDGPGAGAMDPPRDLMGMIFEGVRRHDEWKRAAALIKDDARFAATGKDRKIKTEEKPDLVENLWATAAPGSTASECEDKFAVDSYRVRTLLASWVEIDALKLA